MLFGIDVERVSLIRNGIEWQRYAPGPGERARLRAQLLKELEVPPEARLVTSVARVVPIKGQSVLVRAASAVIKRCPGCLFLLVGEADPAYRLECEQLAREAGVGESVMFLGYREDVAAILAATEVFVHPAFSENMPLSVIEAMAAGLPIVASDVEGVDEIVRNGRDGLLVHPGQPDELARQIIYLLENPAARSALGDRAQENARQFTEDEMLRKTGDCLRSLMAGAPRSP